MGAVIAIVTGVAMVIFWLGRAAKGTSEIVDAAEGLANLPRRYRYQKKAGRSGLALISDVREAAAVLLVAVARLSGDGRVNDIEQKAIEHVLVENMAWAQDDVEDFVLNIRWLTRDLKQPLSTLRPMTSLIQKQVSKQEADDLAHMLTEIAITSSAATNAQTNFIRKYRENMGLN